MAAIQRQHHCIDVVLFIILLVPEVSDCSCLLLELLIVNVHCVLCPIC